MLQSMLRHKSLHSCSSRGGPCHAPPAAVVVHASMHGSHALAAAAPASEPSYSHLLMDRRRRRWHTQLCRAAEQETQNFQQQGSDGEHEEEGEELTELSQARHIITVDNFAPELTKELRGVFDERFADPRRTHPQRFVWDYWWCPDANGTVQYNLVRTQAQVYFSEAQHAALVDALLAYGESQLGCRAITPIWMSYYTDGMMQEMHCDNPHGPFAFVLSLTPWEGREFVGGETQVLQPGVLNYWHTYSQTSGLEHRDLITLVPPLFSRLTVFDPRFPHGVRQVHGTRDPRKGRLVLHGWFTDPSPFIEGGLSQEQVTPVLNEALSGAIEALQEDEDEDGVPGLGAHPCTGVLSLRANVSGVDGIVTGVDILADTLIPLPSIGVDPHAVRARVQHELVAWLMDAHFPSGAADTRITIPVVFE